jgi:hypothetical protein
MLVHSPTHPSAEFHSTALMTFGRVFERALIRLRADSFGVTRKSSVCFGWF